MNKNKKLFELNKDYDIRSDSLYLYITDKYEYGESIEIEGNVILDFDKNSVPVAIEILNASKFLGVSKFSIKNLITLKLFLFIIFQIYIFIKKKIFKKKIM
jgi:uncharacterized protein YuzE